MNKNMARGKKSHFYKSFIELYSDINLYVRKMCSSKIYKYLRNASRIKYSLFYSKLVTFYKLYSIITFNQSNARIEC